jgi:hypothetical protein
VLPLPELGGVDGGVLDGVAGPVVADPICRIPGMFRASGMFSDRPPNWRLIPLCVVEVSAVDVGVGVGLGAALAAKAGIRKRDADAPTSATPRRIVETPVKLTRPMSPLRSNRFSRRLHNPTSAQVSYL